MTKVPPQRLHTYMIKPIVFINSVQRNFLNIFLQTRQLLYKVILILLISFQLRYFSLPLLSMACRMHLGFENFSAFDSATRDYQNAENVQFCKRDSRTIPRLSHACQTRHWTKKRNIMRLCVTVSTEERNINLQE